MHPLREKRRNGAACGETSCVRIARRDPEILDALNLVYQAYLRSGLIGSNPEQLRVTQHHLLHTTQVLVAVSKEEVISTTTLIPDSLLGLPMEELYGEEVSLRRRRTRGIAEVSCLADRRKGGEANAAADQTGDADGGGGSRGDFSVLLKLMSLTAQAAAYQGVEELLIAVHPRHSAFYRRFFGFELIGDLKAYESVNNNPAVPLSLNLEQLPSKCPKGYKRLFGSRFSDEELTRARWSPELQRRLGNGIELPEYREVIETPQHDLRVLGMVGAIA